MGESQIKTLRNMNTVLMHVITCLVCRFKAPGGGFRTQPPCIRQLRPRYERQSKPWCPVSVLGYGGLRFRMLRLKTEETPVFCVYKQKQEFIAPEAI